MTGVKNTDKTTVIVFCKFSSTKGKKTQIVT